MVVQIRAPFWGALNIRCRTIIRDPKGTTILTTTQYYHYEIRSESDAKDGLTVVHTDPVARVLLGASPDKKLHIHTQRYLKEPYETEWKRIKRPYTLHPKSLCKALHQEGIDSSMQVGELLFESLYRGAESSREFTKTYFKSLSSDNE